MYNSTRTAFCTRAHAARTCRARCMTACAKQEAREHVERKKRESHRKACCTREHAMNTPSKFYERTPAASMGELAQQIAKEHGAANCTRAKQFAREQLRELVEESSRTTSCARSVGSKLNSSFMGPNPRGSKLETFATFSFAGVVDVPLGCWR